MATLIIYYSRKGENYWNGTIKNLAKGNTEIAAEFIKNAVGGDLFEVQTVREYAKDYYACIDEAQRELRARARPPIKAFPEDIDRYDNIFIGYPNWWGTMPWRCSRCWSTLIGRAGRSFPSAPTRAAVWVHPNAILQRRARARRLRAGSRSMAQKRCSRKKRSPTGLKRACKEADI